MSTMLGNGVYDCTEAAKLTGLKRARIREWFRQRPTGAKRSPVFRSDYAPVDGHHAISFFDLLDVFVAGQLREHGVSLQTLRQVHARLGEELGTPHPFCRKELLSDGKVVFMRGLDDKGREEVKEVLTKQKVFPEIILPFLERIDYGKATRMAERWHIDRLVVLDPTICLGQPIVEGVCVPTAVLSAAYHANDQDVEAVAAWYNVHPDHVLAAVQFETRMAA